jgi:hypothetical protein
MGTRGVTGFRLDGADKIAYQQFDSYPSGVGRRVVEELHELLKDRTETETAIRRLVLVNEKTPPTVEQVEQLAAFTDLRVSKQSTDDWYCLLREAQGSPKLILMAGHILDSSYFMADSLFNEWGYIANFDDGVLEVYRGFQKSPHDKGRYANMPVAKEDRGYWPVALAGTIPFDLIERYADAARMAMEAFESADRDDDEEAA